MPKLFWWKSVSYTHLDVYKRQDLADDITVVGKGAGSVETASAILSDIVSIWKMRNKKNN